MKSGLEKKHLGLYFITSRGVCALNCDDTGSLKSVFYGGVERARVSPQNWKYSVRNSEFFKDLLKHAQYERATQTRQVVSEVEKRLSQNVSGKEKKRLEAACEAFRNLLRGTTNGNGNGKANKKKKEEKQEDGEEEETKVQVMRFSDRERELIGEIIEELVKGSEKEKDFPKIIAKRVKSFEFSSDFIPTIDLVSLGRMATSDSIRSFESACSVGHTITTHPFRKELEYFSASDELNEEMELTGGAHQGNKDVGTGTYYGGLSIALRTLAENCGFDLTTEEGRKTAYEIALILAKSFIFSRPKTQKSNTNPNQDPELILVTHSTLPLDYANAFEVPVSRYNGGGYKYPSVKRLLEKVSSASRKIYTGEAGMPSQDWAYWVSEEIEKLAQKDGFAPEGGDKVDTIPELCKWIEKEGGLS